MTQRTLEFQAHARRRDPGTSHGAAASLAGKPVAELQQRVLDAIRALGGRATINDVARHTGLAEVSVSPRFKPLRRRGLIRDSGERRRNPSGRRAIVWEVVDV